MQKQHETQRGAVAFMVTIIMILVISLIVIGFTQIVQRAQREALDRQLASQAQYAAESGINRVIAMVDGDWANANKTDCTNNGTIYSSFNSTIDTTHDVKITCVLVNATPDDIRVSATQSASTVVAIELQKSDGTVASAQNLSFRWSTPSGVDPNGSDCSNFSGSAFPAEAGGCKFGLLRVDLMQASGITGTLSALDLTNRTLTFFMKPTQDGAATTTVSAFGGSHGVIVPAKCNDSCVATVVLQGAAAGQKYYARLNTLYREAATVVIDGNVAGVTNDARFSNAQIIIDATGKAQDVLKRIQVRYPVGVRYDATVPNRALQTSIGGSVCKKFTFTSDHDLINECPTP